jgi:outer membrane protein TolC
MLGVGIMNMPLVRPGFSDEMTMATVMLNQTFVVSGRLGLMRTAATAEAEAARAAARAELLGASAEIARAYYEIAYRDRALALLERNRRLLTGIAATAESRYSSGNGAQQEVLGARLALTRVAEVAADLIESRRGRLAELNALIDRASDSPVSAPAILDSITSLAVSRDAASVAFTSSLLGARAANSPFASVEVLQARAAQHNPEIQEQSRMVDVAQARERVAGSASKPDLDVSLQYGVRPGMDDMISVSVSAPLALRKKKNQDVFQAAAEIEVAAAVAERDATIAKVRGEVAVQHAELERARSQLALYRKTILPQAAILVESALTNFSVGKASISAVLDAATSQLELETTFERLLADFAIQLASLQATVGGEVTK